MTADELCIEVSVQTMIDALEDCGDYKVFEDSTDGCESALEWIKETEFVHEDTLLPLMLSSTRFILDRIRRDETVDYACCIHLNKVVDNIVENANGQLDTRCDDLIQAIIMHKGVDYVLDQCGLDNRVTRACTTDYYYVVDALKDRRSMFIAEDELGALIYVMHKITASKTNMETLGKYLESNCSEELIDAMLGPIYSDKIIRHVESSIDAMVVRMQEEPNDHLIGVFVQYLQREGYIGNLISMMRATGVPLEKIIRHYIDDALTEEKSMMDKELY